MGSREELLFSPHSLKKPVFSPHEEALTKLVVCLIQIVKEPKLPTLSYRYFCGVYVYLVAQRISTLSTHVTDHGVTEF